MISTGRLTSERVMLKQDRFFAVSAGDGSMRSGEFSGDGLWEEDTRILSMFRVLIDGLEPELVRHRIEAGAATFELARDGVLVTRERFVDAGLHERITVTNPGPATVDRVLEIEVGADFAAMLAVRGAVDLPPAQPARATRTVDGVSFGRAGAPGFAT